MDYKRWIPVVLLSLFLWWAVQPAVAEKYQEERVLVVAGDENFPPYEFLDTIDGVEVYRGFNVDILKAVALSTGYEIQFRPMPWAEALKALERGEVQAVGGMKYNQERLRVYDFSEPYMTNSLGIFVRKDMQAIGSINDLAGYTVAVQKEASGHYRLKNQPVDLIATASQGEAIELLLAGKVDAAFGNTLTGQYILQRTKNQSSVKIVGGPIDLEGYCVAVKRGDPIIKIFDQGLYEIKKNGTYDKIYAKWFGEPVDHPTQYYKRNFGRAMAAVVILTFIGIFVFLINLYLQREVKKRTHEIEKINEELQHKDKLEALGKLVACIAHEIRTPLTSIKTFVELLPAKYDNPLFRERISCFVPQEIERINAIINDLLNYANPGKKERECVSLKWLVDNTIVFFADNIAKQRIDLQINIQEAIMVKIDTQQMRQVMINIILNALQAVENIAAPSLAITGEIKDSQAYLQVSDNGSGIADESLKYIFEPFFTTKEGGTGLGLFVSYQLARQNDVDIVINSQAGAGTQVLLKFSPEDNQQ